VKRVQREGIGAIEHLISPKGHAQRKRHPPREDPRLRITPLAKEATLMEAVCKDPSRKRHFALNEQIVIPESSLGSDSC
jgi:hypothetical protein